MDKQQIEAIRKRMPSYDRPGKSELLTPYGTAMQDATALLKAYDALAARLAEAEKLLDEAKVWVPAFAGDLMRRIYDYLARCKQLQTIRTDLENDSHD